MKHERNIRDTYKRGIYRGTDIILYERLLHIILTSSVASRGFSPAMQIFSCSLTVKTINF